MVGALRGAGLVPALTVVLVLTISAGAGAVTAGSSGTAAPGTAAPGTAVAAAGASAGVAASDPGTSGAGASARTTSTTVSADGPSGMNLDAAWKLTQGSPGITVAYIEGGINWHLGDAASLASVVQVNWHVTPVPCTGPSLATATMEVGGITQACHTVYSPSEADYDVDGSGIIDAAQWAHDPRVTDANGNGVLDPEDLITAFCGAAYHPPLDRTGRPCDISGWDFYDNQNDPATVDSAYQHANDQMDVIHHECPRCTILPVKAGDEALDPTDNLAKAWQFAADDGARVIVSVTADLGYSSFMRQTIDELHRRGVVMVEASNDFDSTDHQGGMYWPYVIPGNGAVATAAGNAWTRSDETSWGTHSIFTVPTGGGSTSESTPTTGGVIALLLSDGLKAYQEHLIDQPLTGPEAVQVLQDTAKPFTDTSLPWAGSPIQPGSPDGWNLQYGYGMPDLLVAMQHVQDDRVPAEASIDSPEWYSTFDPTTASQVPVTGTIVPSTPGGSYSWKLEAGPGGQPAESAYRTIGRGTRQGPFSGTLGTLDLSSIPSSFWESTYKLATDKSLSNVNQYAVTLRLEVIDHDGVRSEDRRAIDVVHDPSLVPGFPVAVTASGTATPSGAAQGRDSVEGSPQLVDLQGTGRLDIVFGDSSGLIHAVDPATGRELPGWPVRTAPVPDVVPHPGIDPGGQPVISTVAVGDLFHTGQLEVVATTVDGTVEVYDAHGQLLPGWPKHLGTGLIPPPIPRPEEPHVRLPTTETLSSPVLVDLQGTGELDVVVAGGDGQIHAWQPDGAVVPGWPVEVTLPSSFTLETGYLLEDDQRLVATPTVAWFDGRSAPPSIVERSQFTEITGSGIQPFPFSVAFAFNADGAERPGWPVTVPGEVEYYGSAQDFITEGASSPVAATVDGSGNDVVIDGPLWTPPVEITGDGTIAGSYGDPAAVISSLLTSSGGTTAQCQKPLSSDVPVPFTSSGAVGMLANHLAYAQSAIGSGSLGCLTHNNAGAPLTNYETAFPANAADGGASRELAGFPARRQGDGFLSAPVITDVNADGQWSVVEGGDSSAVGATTGSGRETAGWPKFTTGWDLSAPAAGDLLSDGHVDVVTLTREGYLYAWSTPGPSSRNDQWWTARHDEHNSGNYGVRSRPPGALLGASWSAPTATATFVAPGATWYTGTVQRYLVTLQPSGRSLTVKPSGPAGTTQTIRGAAGTTGMSVQAEDGAGNLGPRRWFGTPGTDRRRPGQPGRRPA